jgi:hypothetical protein
MQLTKVMTSSLTHDTHLRGDARHEQARGHGALSHVTLLLLHARHVGCGASDDVITKECRAEGKAHHREAVVARRDDAARAEVGDDGSR